MKTRYLVADPILPVQIKNSFLENLAKKGVVLDESTLNLMSVELVNTIVTYVDKNSFATFIRCEAADCDFKTTKPERCKTCHHNLDAPKEIDCESASCKKYLSDPGYCKTSCHHNRARK